MTCAWYGHLKYPHSPLWIAILVSRGIAFFEYCLQVPANRLGYGEFNGAQLKTIQEIITLLVFAGFSVLYLVSWREPAQEPRGRFPLPGGRRLLHVQGLSRESR
jgi:uncharacterized protein (DUF486 family)